MLPFKFVLQLFKDAGVPGLSSQDSIRRAFHAGKLPGIARPKTARKSKPGDSGRRIFFEPGPVYDIIGTKIMSKVGESTVDQDLVRYYEASPENNPITALAEKISPTLGKAQQVFRDWHECKRNPFVIASEVAKKERERRAAAEAAAEAAAANPDSTRCPSCQRLPLGARADVATLVRFVTGEERDVFDISEELELSEFSPHRCSTCWSWLPSAPKEAMYAKLQEFARHVDPASEPTSGPAISPTPEDTGGGRTSGGMPSADPGADAEEVPPLPTR